MDKDEYTIGYRSDEGPCFRVDSVKSCHWAFFSAISGDLVCKGTHFLCVPSAEELSCWSEAVKPYAKFWKDRLSDLEKILYIRYGNLPAGGQSRNHANWTLEAGISVYPAKYALSGAIIFDGDYGVWQGGTLIEVMWRTPYLVEGDYVGKDGSDGEPLLCNVRKIAILRYDPEKKGFFVKRKCRKVSVSSSSRKDFR